MCMEADTALVSLNLDSSSEVSYEPPEDMLRERRKLHEWLLEPLYSLRGGDGVAAAGR